MKKLFCSVVAVAAVLTFTPQAPILCVGEAFAVKPPSQEVRTEAEKGHEKKKKEKGKEIKASGCPYGKDKKTGKCYKPREGQFYEDSQGNVHVKETKCVNLPWKPCGGSTPPASKEKGKEKKKEKVKGSEKPAKKGSASAKAGSVKPAEPKAEVQKPAASPAAQAAPASGARGAGTDALR